MYNRRVFLGSAGIAGAGAALGALHQTFSAQDTVPSAGGSRGLEQKTGSVTTQLVQELHRQLRQGVEKSLAHDPDGVRQLAITLRIYASTQDHAALRSTIGQVIKTKGRNSLLYAEVNHGEIERLAQELGVPRWQLPPHTAPDPHAREAALTLLMDEGLGAFMRRAADALDDAAASLDARGGRIQRVALQPGNCGSCEYVCGLAENAYQFMEVACAAAGAFLGLNPALNEICAAAAATWLTLMVTCALCGIAICQ